MSTNKRKSNTAGTERRTSEDAAAIEFGRRLRAARTARGATLRDVANEAGVSIAYLSDLERAVLTNPTLDKLRKIADTLGASIDDLLDAAPIEPSSGSVPAALQEFAASPGFQSEVEAQAQKWRRDPGELRDEWIRLLGAIQLGGRRPSGPSDYLFIFETIRRAIDA